LQSLHGVTSPAVVTAVDTIKALSKKVETDPAAIANVAARDLIRINCIAPGWTNSPSAYNQLEGDEQGGAQLLAKLQPIPRAGAPDDIAKLGVFLASDDAHHITGSYMIADGG